MPEDNNPSIANLNDNLNKLTEQRLMAEHDAALHAYRNSSSTTADELRHRLRRAEDALDTFWEARTADQQQLAAQAQNLPGMPGNTNEWFQQTEVPDERRRIAGPYVDDPEAIAEAAGVMGTDHTVPVRITDPNYRTANTAAAIDFANEVDGWYSPEWQRQADINDGIQPAAEYRPQAHRGPVGITGQTRPGHHASEQAAQASYEARRSLADNLPASFADEVDAWYAAVQPTGEVRRVQDADLFDPDGYSQPADAVATAAPPVSDEFAAAFQPGNGWEHRPENNVLPDGPATRWEARMAANPSLASAVTRHPSAGQGPPMPQPGLSPKV